MRLFFRKLLSRVWIEFEYMNSVLCRLYSLGINGLACRKKIENWPLNAIWFYDRSVVKFEFKKINICWIRILCVGLVWLNTLWFRCHRFLVWFILCLKIQSFCIQTVIKFLIFFSRISYTFTWHYSTTFARNFQWVFFTRILFLFWSKCEFEEENTALIVEAAHRPNDGMQTKLICGWFVYAVVELCDRLQINRNKNRIQYSFFPQFRVFALFLISWFDFCTQRVLRSK